MDTKLNPKLEVRSGSGTEFQPKNDVENFVVETIEQIYKEKGISTSQVAYICDDDRISILLHKNPWKEEAIDEIAESISESLKQKMENENFAQIGTVKAEYFLMLNFVRKTKLRKLTPNDQLKEAIEKILTDEYEEYGVESTAQVLVDDKKEVRILINSEEPYLGMNFWEFMGKASEKVECYLNENGYTYQKGEWLYDYREWYFTYTGDKA